MADSNFLTIAEIAETPAAIQFRRSRSLRALYVVARDYLRNGMTLSDLRLILGEFALIDGQQSSTEQIVEFDCGVATIQLMSIDGRLHNHNPNHFAIFPEFHLLRSDADDKTHLVPVGRPPENSNGPRCVLLSDVEEPETLPQRIEAMESVFGRTLVIENQLVFWEANDDTPISEKACLISLFPSLRDEIEKDAIRPVKVEQNLISGDVVPLESSISEDSEAEMAGTILDIRHPLGEAMVGIRPATEEDWESIWQIFKSILLASDTYPFSPDMSSTEAKRYWMASENQTYVATSEREVVGAYLIRPNAPGLGAHIANAAYIVENSQRSRGIGRALAEHSFKVARAHGFVAMQFNFVISSNARAIDLWIKLGFDIVGRVPLAFRHPHLGLIDVLIMYRWL